MLGLRPIALNTVVNGDSTGAICGVKLVFNLCAFAPLDGCVRVIITNVIGLRQYKRNMLAKKKAQPFSMDSISFFMMVPR